MASFVHISFLKRRAENKHEILEVVASVQIHDQFFFSHLTTLLRDRVFLLYYKRNPSTKFCDSSKHDFYLLFNECNT